VLLLPLAPWLFVGTGPLALAGFLRARDLGQLNTFVGLIPPTWLSIPALVLFTLFFRTRQARIVTALPLAAFALLMVWLLSAQEILWPYLVAQTPDHRTAPLALLTSTRALTGGDGAAGLVLPLPVLLLFTAAFIALQVGYLDRLAVRTGRDDPGPVGQQSPPGPQQWQQLPPQPGQQPAAPPTQPGPVPPGGQLPAAGPPPG
jgi:hypothetical protein